MQTIWFPAPVFVLFRRLVNVVSTLSISHQYFLQASANSGASAAAESNDRSSSWKVLKSLGWLSWAGGEAAETKFSLALEGDSHQASSFQPPQQTQRQSRPPPQRNRPLDVIHRLMTHPALFDPVRAPRNPVVLCHGTWCGFYHVDFTLTRRRVVRVRCPGTLRLSNAEETLLVQRTRRSPTEGRRGGDSDQRTSDRIHRVSRKESA